jgi:hypothetical protein
MRNIAFDDLAAFFRDGIDNRLKYQNDFSEIDFGEVSVSENEILIRRSPKTLSPFRPMGSIIFSRCADNSTSCELKPYNDFKIVALIGFSLMTLWTLVGLLVDSGFWSMISVCLGWLICVASIALLYFVTRARLHQYQQFIEDKLAAIK